MNEYLQENQRYFEIVGIDKYHQQDIKGQGLKIAILDTRFDTQSIGSKKIYNNKVIGIGEFDNNAVSSHGTATAHILHQILPEAIIYCLKASTESVNWCIENDVDIINISMKLFKREGFEEALNDFVDKGGLVFTSSGNTSEDRTLGIPAKYESCIAVGAVHLRYEGKSNEKIYRADYSSFTKEEKDYIWEMTEVMGFAGIWIMTPKYPEPDHNGKLHTFQFHGTSCSSPFVTGMAGLVRQVNRMNIDEFREFIKAHTMDLEEEGWDRFTGHGLFILPNPEDIDVNRYIDAETKEEGDGKIMKPNKIIIHHSATDDTPAQNFEGIRNHHINVNGWADIGYHYVIENVNGKYITIPGRAENMAGVHCPGQNSQSLGICLVGDFRKGPPPKEQLEETARTIKDIYTRHGELPLHGHDEFVDTECPCFDLKLITDLLEKKEELSMSWQEEQGLEHLNNLVEKEIIDSPEYWKNKMLEPMPTWAFFSLIDRITKDNK